MEATIFKIILYTCLLIFTILFLKNIKNFKQNQKQIEKVILIIMFSVQIVRHITYVSMGQITWLIPFHICNISGILICIWLFTKNKQIQAPLFFLSFMAAAALVYPAVDYPWTNPLYYTFIIDHIVLLFVPFYMVIVYDYVPKFKDLIITFISIEVLMVIGLLLNKPLNENYFYLTERPLFQTIPFGLYFTIYALILFTCFVVVYALGNIIKNKRAY